MEVKISELLYLVNRKKYTLQGAILIIKITSEAG